MRSDRAPRLLCVYQHAPTLGAPGIYRHRLYFAELVRRGWHVDLISTPINYMTGTVPARYTRKAYVREQLDGIETHWVWASGGIHASKLRRALNYATFAASALVRAVTLRRPDVVLVSSPPLSVGLLGPLLSRRFRVPWLLEVRDIWPESAVSVGWMDATSRTYRALERAAHYLARDAAAAVVPTPGLTELVRAHGARQVEVVSGAVTDASQSPQTRAAVRRELGIGDHCCLFLYLGAVGVANGLDLLVDAAARLPPDTPAMVLIIGDGSARRGLEERLVREERKNIRILDPVPKDRVNDYLAASDVCLHVLRPDPVFATALPSKVLDYFSAHRPFITSVPGLPQKLAEQSGGSFAPTADALATELRRWTELQPSERAEYGQRSFEYGLANFGLTPSADRLEQLLRSTIEQGDQNRARSPRRQPRGVINLFPNRQQLMSATVTRFGSAVAPSTAIGTALAALCVLAGIESVTSPSTLGLVVVGVALVLLALRNLVWLLAAFTVLTFPDQLPLGFGGGTIAKPLGVLLVLSWALHLVRHSDAPFLPRDQPFLAAALTAFFAFAVTSTLWATETGPVVSNASRLVQMTLLFVIVFTAVRTRDDLFILTGAYVFAAVVTAAYAITSGVTVAGRLTGGISNPNFLAAELVVAIVLAGFMLAATRTPVMRGALVASIVLNAVGLTLTQSRGGIIALATALAVAIFMGGRLRPYVIVGVLLSIVAGATYYVAIAAPAVRDRLTNISAQGSAGRADEWAIAFRIFRGHSIGGAGLGNYSVLAPNYVTQNLQLLRVNFVLRGFVAHNTYLQILSELGIIGSTLFAGFLLGVIGLAVTSLRRGALSSDHRASAVARGVIVALIGLLAAYFFASALYAKQLWLLLALAAALATVTRTPNDAEDAHGST